MALAKAVTRREVMGVPRPRIAPPRPARHLLVELEAAAADLGITFMEWQRIAGRYMTALGPHDRWMWRRFAAIVGRQNGKTEIIKPRVLMGFKRARKMLHVAQDRSRPRKSTFVPLVEFFAKQRNREAYDIRKIREANGQEEIVCFNGASYTIAAPTSGGARGDAVDDIFADEVREFEGYTVDGIIRPTITARPNPQICYFSNAGHAGSLILNDLRAGREDDRNLAYLEWSAAPELDRLDERAWAQANPALGTTIDIETLRDFAATMEPAIFETEHLCRWVTTTKPSIVHEGKWDACKGPLDAPLRSVLGIKVDQYGRRASAVAAWQQRDGIVAVRPIADVTGDPIDVARFATALQTEQRALRAFTVIFDPWTDGELASYFKGAKPLNGQGFADASTTFARLIENGQIRWDGEDVIGPDLPWTVQKATGRSFMAVAADKEHPITAVEAAIRAVGKVVGPGLNSTGRVLVQ